MSAYLGGLKSSTGVVLASEAFSTVLPFGGRFVAIAVALFAFSTILGWSYYGAHAIECLFGVKAIVSYKVVLIAVILLGCLTALDLVWNISDTFNGLMALPNLVAITKEYLDKNKIAKLK